MRAPSLTSYGVHNSVVPLKFWRQLLGVRRPGGALATAVCLRLVDHAIKQKDVTAPFISRGSLSEQQVRRRINT